MGLFSKKPKYVPKTGDVTLTRDQFKVMMRTQAVYRRYVQAVGVVAAPIAVDNAFTESLRSMSASGYWQFGTSANFGNPQALKFPDETALKTFMMSMETLFDFDIRKINDRAVYTNGLKGKAQAGLLLTDLQNNTEPEGTYYQAPVPVPQKIGSPPVPPKSADQINQSKGRSWLTHGVQGDKTAFNRTLMKMSKFDGTFPLGADTTLLFEAWHATVPLAPVYRGWNNTASQQKYPSNIGGKKVLEDIITDLSTTAMPPRGDNAWYGLALYLLGSIVTTQAFTDGNKRMSRFAYVLMLLSGGVAMNVPTNGLGGRLGDMM